MTLIVTSVWGGCGRWHHPQETKTLLARRKKKSHGDVIRVFLKSWQIFNSAAWNNPPSGSCRSWAPSWHQHVSQHADHPSDVELSDLTLMFPSCRHVRQLQAETQHLWQRRQERSEEQTEEVHHQTSVHEDAAGERTHQRSLLRLYSRNHQHTTFNELLGCLGRSIFSGQ